VKALLTAALAVMLLATSPSPGGAPSRRFAVPDSPSSLALSADGRVLFVGVDRRFGRGGSVVAYRRVADRFVELARLRVAGGTQSLALAPDGKTLVVATRVGIAVVAVAPFIAGKAVHVAVTRDGDAPATNQVIVSADGRYAFFTNAADATLGVARIDAGRDGKPTGVTIVGHVAVDRVPGGLALAPDGRTLYVTSEVSGGDPARVGGALDPRLGRTRCTSNLGPHGVLTAIDVAKASTDPGHAVLARIAAGCGPVRVALAPDGDIAWVSVRGENRVLAFATARLRDDPEHALLASVDVGALPVGLAVSLDGAHLLVANSNRSADPDAKDGSKPADLSLIDPAAALAGKPSIVATIATGALPREVLPMRDGTFLVTDYNANVVDVVTIPGSPVARGGQP
jgi:DNA-binding beta-propeller fold protein YncE